MDTQHADRMAVRGKKICFRQYVISIPTLTNCEKAIVINALRERFPLKKLLQTLQIAKSSYCYQVVAMKTDRYLSMREEIRNVFNDSKERYGYRRIHAVLKKEGKKISEKVVRRIMREEDLFVRKVKKRKYSSYQGEITPAVENVINRDFHAEKQNEKWLTDSSLWDTSGFGLTETETERVKFAIQNDCPELMLCKIDFVTADVLAPYSDTTFFRNRADYITTELPACLSELDKLKSTDAWGSSDLKKEEAYEKYIARNTEYLSDRGSDEGKISIDGFVRVPSSAILYRAAVCEGFANSTQLAMRYFGIPCIYVSGKASSGGNYAWNLVRIDGEWFQYDATWNGSGKYMNLSDAEMLKKRSVSKDYTRLGFTLPACRK